MSAKKLMVLKLDEERYALDSGIACGKAEDEAQQTGQYPVVYPEPFKTIGLGYGRLSDHIRKHCDDVASELGLETEFCEQTDLLITVYGGTTNAFALFRSALSERLDTARAWIINDSELWPADVAARQPSSL